MSVAFEVGGSFTSKRHVLAEQPDIAKDVAGEAHARSERPLVLEGPFPQGPPGVRQRRYRVVSERARWWGADGLASSRAQGGRAFDLRITF